MLGGRAPRAAQARGGRSLIITGSSTSMSSWSEAECAGGFTSRRFRASTTLPPRKPSEIRGTVPARAEEHILESVTDAPAEEMAVAVAVAQETTVRAPMIANYLFSALAGTTWYMQFFFYTMGETQMGRYKFSSWTLHMASIMIFSTLWGIALREWNGTGRRTKLLVAASLLVLIASTVIVGYGNYLGVAGTSTKSALAR